VKKFLIISVNAIGDTYLSICGAYAINNYFPEAKIDFIIRKNSEFLFSGLNFINEIIIFDNFGQLNELKKEIRVRKYDYCFNYFPGRINTILNLLSGEIYKAGYWNFIKLKDWYTINQNILSNFNKANKFIWLKEYNYLDRINLVFKKSQLPISVNNKFRYSNFNISQFNFDNYILIHSCSKTSERALSNLHLISLTEYLNEAFNYDIIFIGSKNDKNYEFLHSIISDKIRLLTDLTIDSLIFLIKKAKLFLAIDSFPIHLADAYNTSFIGLFGPTNAKSVLINYSKSIQFGVGSLQYLNSEEFISAIKRVVNNE